MPRKMRIPTSLSVKQNAERSYQNFLPSIILRRLGIGGKIIYFYVYGITPEGRKVYWGPIDGATSMEQRDQAEAAASGLINGEVYEIDTRDTRRATAAMKADQLKRGSDPDQVLQRVSHTGFKDFLNKIRHKQSDQEID